MGRPVIVLVVLVLLSTALRAAPATEAEAAPCDRLEMVVGQGPSCRTEDGWLVKLADGEWAMTHGPDKVDALGTEGVGVLATPQAPWCVADPNSEHHMRVIYAVPADKSNRYTSVVGSIRAMVDESNGRLREDAAEVGRRVDYKVRCSGGVVDVANEQLPTGSGSDSFSTIVSDLRARGYTSTTAKYWVWYDDDVGPGIGGQGHVYNDDRLILENYNNAAPGTTATFAVSYGSQVGFSSRVWMHENGHNLGAVQHAAPQSSGGFHCNDGRDVMCYADGGPTSNYNHGVCTDRERFDCNRDTYFHPGAATGWLATHWNLGSTLNRFLRNVPLVDTGAPTVTVTSPASGAIVAPTVSLAFSASDDIGVATATVGVDGAYSGSGVVCTPTLAGQPAATACTKALTLSGGAHTLTARATDAAGNVGTSASVVVTVDATPPTGAITSPTGTVEGDASITVSATVADNLALAGANPARVKVGGGAYQSMTCSGSATSQSCTWAWTTPPLGTHTLTLLVTDSVGLSVESSVTVTVVDTTPPVLEMTQPLAGNVYANGVRVGPCPVASCTVLTGTFVANQGRAYDKGSGIASAKVFLDTRERVSSMSGTSGGCRTASSPCSLSGSFVVARPGDVGARTLRVVVTDFAGNSATYSLPVVVG